MIKIKNFKPLKQRKLNFVKGFNRKFNTRIASSGRGKIKMVINNKKRKSSRTLNTLKKYKKSDIDEKLADSQAKITSDASGSEVESSSEEIKRCWNAGPEMEAYHDDEWGIPMFNDRELFEMLCLEGQQAGLSWKTILKKRPGYREQYYNFDAKQIIANLSSSKAQEKVRQNAGIIRHRGKIKSIVDNAGIFLELQEEYGSFAGYLWNFVDFTPLCNEFATMKDLPASTEISTMIAKTLKKRGFKFLGPTTVYAFMQASGMVNDHFTGCHKYQDCKLAQENALTELNELKIKTKLALKDSDKI